MTDIVSTGADMIPSSLEQAREFIRASKAANTLRGYRSDWRDFVGWCEGHAVCPLPASPEVVASYIAECAGRLKVGTIQRRLNAIAEAHKAVGLESPAASGMVRNTLKGIRRSLGTAPAQKAAALTDFAPSSAVPPPPQDTPRRTLARSSCTPKISVNLWDCPGLPTSTR